MTDSIYEEPGDDYPSADVEELLDMGDLPEMDEYTDSKATSMPLDDRIALKTYAFATRREKYEIYKRFKAVRSSLSLNPRRK